MQKREETHDIAIRLQFGYPCSGATLVGEDHEDPLNIRIAPPPSTLAQNVFEAHETAVSFPYFGSFVEALVQVELRKIDA
jgi:hypothetical protein